MKSIKNFPWPLMLHNLGSKSTLQGSTGKLYICNIFVCVSNWLCQEIDFLLIAVVMSYRHHLLSWDSSLVHFDFPKMYMFTIYGTLQSIICKGLGRTNWFLNAHYPKPLPRCLFDTSTCISMALTYMCIIFLYRVYITRIHTPTSQGRKAIKSE